MGKGKAAQRYIVTVNEAEAKKDREDRQAMIDGLQAQLKKGDKALIGNSAYRRYLRSRGNAFEIDPGKLAEEARVDDGLAVLPVRWTIKIGGKIRYRPDGTPLPQIALPVFGYKSHIAIDRRFGFIRESAVTSTG